MFNPVKDDSKEGSRARRQIWSTEAIDCALEGLRAGKRLLANPFYENNTKLLKSDLNFERTPEELSEYKKCMSDVLYFADQCKLMTPEGIQHVQFRDYQKKYLRHVQDNRLSIYLACRQCGKCVTFWTRVTIRIDWALLNVRNSARVKTYFDKRYRQADGCYELPLYEIYNLYDKRPSWKIRYFLYRYLPRRLAQEFISELDFFLENPSRAQDGKIMHEFGVSGISIKSDRGFFPMYKVFMTIPFWVYRLRLSNGLRLECADHHLVFDSHNFIHRVSDLILIPEDTQIATIEGPAHIEKIELGYGAVCMCDVSVRSGTHSYYSDGILSHNTTTSAIFLLWYVLFNIDKNALVIGSKRRVAIEILDKLKKIFYELPYYLKPGVLKWNESEVVFDNGCRILAEATTINSGISYTFHCVLADEFAHVPPNILDKFYNNLFPTITAGKARFMITSTQNGRNLFYRLYKAAEAGENDYAPFKTDWYEVPEWDPAEKVWRARDEDWHKRQVANYGSEEAFNAQFGTNFDISTNTLISQKKLRSLSPQKFESQDLWGVSKPEEWFWSPGLEPMTELRKRALIITCDLSEQIGQDYSVFEIWGLSQKEGKTIYELLGYYRSNRTDREISARSLLELVTNYISQDRLILSNERNTYGEIFVKTLLDLAEKEFPSFDPGCLCKYWNETQTQWKYGCRISPGSKTTHCGLFKELLEKDLILASEERFVYELENFIDSDGGGHYSASFGHDDMVMAGVQLIYVSETLQHKILLEEIAEGGSLRESLDDWDQYGALGDISRQLEIYGHADFLRDNRARLR